MALFQITAIEKYSTAQDQKVVKEKWGVYKVYFHDSKIQDNITNVEFLKELKKKKIKLSLFQEREWEDYFLGEQEKAVMLKTQIDTTDTRT